MEPSGEGGVFQITELIVELDGVRDGGSHRGKVRSIHHLCNVTS